MSNQLPEILKVSVIKDIENMNIKTEVLDPITINQSQAVFQIPRNGVLDGGSMVQLGVTVASDMFFPITTGIHGLIKSCSLRVGGKVIASNDDYGYYTTMTRQFESPEHRAYVDMVKSGACGDRFSEGESGRLVYRDLVATIDPTPTNSELFVPEFIKPTSNDSTTPLFTVPLSTLIPMMKSRQLPLMAINENVFLHINFNSQVQGQFGIICCKNSSATNTAVTVSQPNIKFISDHLYYTSDKMDSLVEQTLTDKGLTFLYEDLISTNANVPAVTVTSGVVPQVIERQIAVAGRTVRNIMVHEKEQSENHEFLGQYLSRDLQIPSAYNLRINDQRVYDRDVVDAPRKYNELEEVLGKPLMVPNQLYSYAVDTNNENVAHPLNQNSVYIGKIEGFSLPPADNSNVNSDIRCSSHFIGYNATVGELNELGNGARIGVKPITLNKTYYRQSDAKQKSAREMRIFSGVERVLNIKNGKVTISA